MAKLAAYYDVINNIPEEERPMMLTNIEINDENINMGVLNESRL